MSIVYFIVLVRYEELLLLCWRLCGWWKVYGFLFFIIMGYFLFNVKLFILAVKLKLKVKIMEGENLMVS